MAEYRNRTTGEVKSQGEWRRVYSGTSLPRVWNSNVFDALDLDPILQAPKPEVTGDYQRAQRDGVTQDDNGNWVYAWKIVDMFSDYVDEEGNTVTKAEQEQQYQTRLDSEAADRVRTRRDSLLEETDWVVVKYTELGEAIPAEWTTYRQALRDITTHANFPHLNDDEDWPAKPVV